MLRGEYGTIRRIEEAGLLELKDLSLAEDRAPLNFQLGDTQVGVVLGRNHSGKTRLARTVAGLQAPVAGQVFLDGVDVTDQDPARRSVGLVYQAFVNYPTLTVAQNIASPLVARREAPGERVAQLAALLGLEDVLERLPSQLSGGQQQRVAIARALAKRPRLLVLDEPLVNLDFKLRESFAVELAALMREQGTAALYTTTDPREAFNLADTVLLLHDHQLVQAGAPMDVYQSPASVQAADLMSDPAVNVWRKDSAVYALRPEQLELERGHPDDVEFQVQVLSVETNGYETFLHVRPKWQEHWVARVVGMPQVRADASISLFAAVDAVMTFGEDGGHG